MERPWPFAAHVIVAVSLFHAWLVVIYVLPASTEVVFPLYFLAIIFLVVKIRNDARKVAALVATAMVLFFIVLSTSDF